MASPASCSHDIGVADVADRGDRGEWGEKMEVEVEGRRSDKTVSRFEGKTLNITGVESYGCRK